MFQNGKALDAAAFYATLTPDAELTSSNDGAGLAYIRLAGHDLVTFEGRGYRLTR